MKSALGAGPLTRTGLKILYVEDDPDLQEMLRTLLELHGYDVTTVGTAHEGLEALRAERFHLVIADYNLPDLDGATMLANAANDGLLTCESLILTGAFRLGSNATAYRVVRKPVDATALLAKLDEILAPVRELELATQKAELSTRRPSVMPPSLDEGHVELALYVSEASRASLRAVRRIRALLERLDTSRVSLEIIDISRERPPSFDEERITFTPTLVKRRPQPKVYFLGALESMDDLLDLVGDVPQKGAATP